MSQADLITRGVSALAFIIALASFLRTRRVDRRNLFLEMHSRLLEPDLVTARRDLYRMGSASTVEDFNGQHADRMTHVYRLLAMYDLLGLYAERRWVSRSTVVDEWGHSLARSIPHAEAVIEWRRDWSGWDSWPHYRKLARHAAKKVRRRTRRRRR